MNVGPVHDVVMAAINDCQKGTYKSVSGDIREWARCRNYFMVLLGMVKESARMSDIQAYVVVEKVFLIMRRNPHADDKVVFPYMEDIQLATYMNTAQ